jgi:diguanylate cyclase (GGDEF)-like protein/PAS domain S-box-containing protein
MPSNQNKRPIFIWTAIAIALLFWLLDTFLDTYIFEGEPFLYELFPVHEPRELWMRFIVASLLIAFGVFANTVTKKRFIVEKNLKTEVQEHREAEKQLSRSEQSLHEFYNISSSLNQDFDTRLERLLKLGCQRFDMDIGILSNINGDEYKVVEAVSPDNGLEKGTIFPLGKTYCQITIDTEDPVSYTYMAESEMQTHPAYIEFKLEAYIGTRILVDGELYGTLNFSSPAPHDREFTRGEMDFLQLMGVWVGAELLRQRSETKLEQASTVFNNTKDGILITDNDRNIIAVNKAFTTITGYTEEEVIGKNPRFLKSDRHDQEFYKNLWKSVSSTGQWQGDIWNRRKDGKMIPVWQNISSVKDDSGNVKNYTSVFSDISSIKQYEEQLKHAAHHDALTNLANRVLFGVHLDHSLQKAKRNKGGFALLFLDLDGFKAVNDSLGHNAGDQLLQCVAQRLEECIRDEDTAARFGGDEFTIILEDIKQATDAELVAAKIINAISEPVVFGDQSISVSASIGISLYPDDGQECEELMHAADSAMFRAKSRGKNNYRLYSRNPEDQVAS